MAIYIHDIATAVPKTHYRQEDIRDIMKNGLGNDRRTEAIIHRVYSQSGIEKRHIVRNDYDPENPQAFFTRALSKKAAPGTAERNKIYKEESPKLFVEVAHKLLEGNPQFSKKDISHVITVSCTGFFAPGPDFEVVRQLDLSPSTKRFHVGFMGCYAMFPALKMAQSFCKSDPDANVLVISAELCTLHLQAKTEPDDLIAASVFADGCSGALVSSKSPVKPAYRLDAFASSLAYEGEKDMAWTIGDKGFNMVLSSYVPDIIGSNLSEVIEPLFGQLSISKEHVDTWAVHPGGRAIIDKVQQSMGLCDCQIQPSRTTLANYGNMSSATILFVLDEILRTKLGHGASVLPIAFGPGLTIETGLFTYFKPD